MSTTADAAKLDALLSPQREASQYYKMTSLHHMYAHFMYALFTFKHPGIGPEDVLYFKSNGNVVPYITSVVDGNEYQLHLLYWPALRH
jgi:hypothetical protein